MAVNVILKTKNSLHILSISPNNVLSFMHVERHEGRQKLAWSVPLYSAIYWERTHNF